jgi:hypothetical protein
MSIRCLVDYKYKRWMTYGYEVSVYKILAFSACKTHNAKLVCLLVHKLVSLLVASIPSGYMGYTPYTTQACQTQIWKKHSQQLKGHKVKRRHSSGYTPFWLRGNFCSQQRLSLFSFCHAEQENILTPLHQVQKPVMGFSDLINHKMYCCSWFCYSDCN